MWRTFKNYGDVDEVIIPLKKDTNGAFQICKVLYVKDKASFARHLNSIIIVMVKLVVNVPRFHRRSDKEVSKSSGLKKGVDPAGKALNPTNQRFDTRPIKTLKTEFNLCCSNKRKQYSSIPRIETGLH